MDQLDERACASAWVIAALLASSLLSPAVVQPAGAPVPEHATPVPYGAGWKCNRGYRQAGTVCLPVEVPENASLNALGNGWRCNRGFFEQGGRCSEVIVPPNATLNSLGNGWICARGFVRENNRCAKVVVPPNATLNAIGNGWVCKRGFTKRANGCESVVVPENASLTALGNDWRCNRSYKRVGNQCQPMSPEEVQKQLQVEREVEEILRARRARRVSGDDCESEYKTNAQVCVAITDASLDCNKSYAGNFYRDCDVLVEYEVRTDYRGQSYLDVDVECTVEIEYSGGAYYSRRSDSDSNSESHMLYAYGQESESVSFNFTFSSFAEVDRVRISSARCEIDDVNMW